ncbi:unnamed protein product [Clonostachys rhizophaga]|uniref:Uncharacterized protein n=1 Tax=Clonostachys rhizophaga TaxID=160324 RepID=A0A9N9VX56_9HYPO|nr:unnamed protein product [Clonostachys rhizophaga]
MFLWASTTFNPATDIPDLSGRVILVTGGNTGLGKQYILELCRHNPAQVWLAARNLDKAQAAVAEIQSQVPGAPIEILEIDLSSLSSVEKAAREFQQRCDRLDILMLNAGIIMAPLGKTQDGYEVHFGTNYMGHALLTKLLLPTIEKTIANQDSPDARILIVSSSGYKLAPKEGIAYESIKTTCADWWNMSRYGQSKLALNLWTRQLAKHYPNIKCASIHPGVVDTELGVPRGVVLSYWSSFLRLASLTLLRYVSLEEGVKGQLWATSTKDLQSGEYYTPIGKVETLKAEWKDDALSKKLWDWTEEELKPHAG